MTGANTKISTGLLQKYSQVFPVGSAGSKISQILARRRKQHLEKLHDSLSVWMGVEREPGQENIWFMNSTKIYQEPALLYLTGINQPNVALILSPFTKEKEILFLPPKDSKREFWDGIRFGIPADHNPVLINDAVSLTGIKEIRPISQLPQTMMELLEKSKCSFAYMFYHDYSPQKVPVSGKPARITSDHNWQNKTRLERFIRGKGVKHFQFRSCAQSHFSLRMPIEDHEKKDMAKAVQCTHDAFINTMGSLPHCQNENELFALLEGNLKKNSRFGISFPSIVAGGANAAVLHYIRNDSHLKSGDLVLMDFGARWGEMHADVTRTIPVSGTFSPLQKLLYEIVLDAMEFNFKQAVPGKTIKELNRNSWEYIEKRLQNDFVAKGGKMTRPYILQPHGVSHLLGAQVHEGDPFRLYQNQPLQPGWMISNEPGIYGHFSIKIDGRSYSQWIGIRIEDDLLITPQKPKNLTSAIPKSTEAIEKLFI